MADAPPTLSDLASLARDAGAQPARRLSGLANRMSASEILRIANEIRALKAAGRAVCDLTVGDFDTRYFPIPARLNQGIRAAVERGQTNYPPSNGLLELRQAVRRFYARALGLDYPLESVLVTSGSRPVIYGAYRILVDPGERVVYPVPSWNNNHYATLVGAVGVPVPCAPERRFLPDREALRELLPGARLLALNSPLNPAGTAFTRDALEQIGRLVLEENEQRERRAERPLYLLYDQIYWMLCFGETRHVTPVGLLPELARYTIFVDGISKAFAATGVRVGWGVGPADVIERMATMLGHVGAWAPRAEQVATLELLDDAAAIEAFRADFTAGITRRLQALHRGFQEMKAGGLPVDTIAPTSAIYLSVRVQAIGRRTSEGGPAMESNEDLRRYLLQSAGVAVVPFQAFGSRQDDGWLRLSVGAVSEAEISQALPRLAAALGALR